MEIPASLLGHQVTDKRVYLGLAKLPALVCDLVKADLVTTGYDYSQFSGGKQESYLPTEAATGTCDHHHCSFCVQIGLPLS